ncbi:unnamed protein product [Meloidogyne enterolobii]|uniref:Uncharacterized protein n=1 Tax=Meloidogyne enterolobii TaxID=390850 RepID=A0ACB0XPZ8_MELEN
MKENGIFNFIIIRHPKFPKINFPCPHYKVHRYEILNYPTSKIMEINLIKILNEVKKY